VSNLRTAVLLVLLSILSLGAAWAQGGVGPNIARSLPEPAGGFYFMAKGSKQGTLATERAGGKWDRHQVGLSFDFRAESPTDRATGLATGQVQYMPLTITREVGPASPQFLNALPTNEIFPQVLLQFLKGSMQGEVWYEITLQNCRLTRVRQYMGLPPGAAQGPQMLLEELVFTYQTLTSHHVAGNTTAVVGK